MRDLHELRPPEPEDTCLQAQHMSKRDFIAVQMMVGMLSNFTPAIGGYEDLAKRAYKMADIMIKESKN